MDSPCYLAVNKPWPPLIRDREIKRLNLGLCADKRYDHIMITVVNKTSVALSGHIQMVLHRTWNIISVRYLVVAP